MQKKVTIKDVAEQLGLSVTTVSLVLNNKGDIPESTRSRIRRVAEDMGYHPDYMARSLVTGKSHIVGVLVPDISNQFFAETVRHLQTELNNYGYDIILCNSEERMDNDIKYIEWLSGRRARCIAGIGFKAELHTGDIRFVAAGDIFADLGCAAEADQVQTRRNRIQRAGVAGGFGAINAFEAGNQQLG